MILAADLDEAFAPLDSPSPFMKGPKCQSGLSPGPCFVGSYAPITPAGEMGPFFVNSYMLQPNRKAEIVGPVSVRSSD
jgi:hypothetical protein